MGVPSYFNISICKIGSSDRHISKVARLSEVLQLSIYLLMCSYVVFFQLKESNELFLCSSGDFIRKRHVCNGITECPDGSDEAQCQDSKLCSRYMQRGPIS